MPIWLIQIVVGIVLSVASTLIEQAWGPKSNTSAASGYSADLKTGGGSAQYFVIGTWGVAGKLEYANTWGSEGDTPNAYLVYVISLGDLPITALTGAFEAGETLTVGTGTHATQGYPIPERRNGSADRFWIDFHDGSQTAANSYLTGTFGADANIPWLADMIGRGIPYVTATALYDRDVWNNTPQCVFQAQGIPLYDPRKDSTAGGSGSQRLADQSTWAFTDNLAVMIYNILVGIRYENAIVWGGRVRQSQLPYAVWAAAMDACDVDIALASGGTEKQFRGGRAVNFSDKPADVISDFLVACNGRIVECAGVYSVLVGAPADPVATFTDADTIVTEDATLDPFPNLDSLVNGAVATYTEPTQAWQTKETAPFAPTDLVAADRGQVLTANIDLTNSVFSGTQAQRVERAAVLEGRRFLKHVVPLRPVWGNYRPLETVAWNSAQNQYSAKGFLITAWTEEAHGNVIYGLQEVDPTADHAWSISDEGALTFAPLIPIKPAAQVIASFAVSAETFNDASGTARRPGIAATWGAGQVDVRAVLVTARVKATAAVEWSGEINYGLFPAGGLLPHAFLPATEYEVQGVYVPFSARPVTASAWLSVTTDDVTDINNIDRQQLSDTLQSVLGFLQDSVGALFDKVSQIGALVADQDIANLADKQQILTTLQSSTGNVVADYRQQITVETSAREALADEVTTLSSTVTTNATTSAAAVQAEQTARASADTALSNSITSLTSTVNGNTSAIQSEATTRATADTSLGARIDTLTSTVGGNTSAIQSEATTRASADTAMADDISALQTTVGDSSAGLVHDVSANTTATSAAATDIAQLYAALGGNSAEVNVGWEAVAAPTGYSARYEIQCMVNDGTARVATLFLDVPADPSQPTRIGVQAGQFVYFASDGTPIQAMDENGVQSSANGAVSIDWKGGGWSFGA